jgi:hypothetical protein
VLLKLLGLPFTLPAAGIRFALDKVIEMAEIEANSEEPIKEELLAMQLQLEEGTIDEKAYVARETVLLARLREIRERRKEMARQQLVEESDGSRIVVEMPEELR